MKLRVPAVSKTFASFVACVFIGAAVVGWSLGGGNSWKPAEAADQHVAGATRPPRPERRTKAVAGPAGESAERLKAIRLTRDPVERLRATIDLASTIPLSEFAAWIDGGWFTLREGADLTLFQKILMERWRQEDPEGLLVWGLEKRSPECDSQVSQWAESDPQRLLDFFKDHPDGTAELRALVEIARNHPDAAFRRFREMIASGLSRNEEYQYKDLLEVLAKQSPGALVAAMDTMPDWLKRPAEELLIQGRMATSFSEEIRKLQDRPDGYEIFKSIYSRGSYHEVFNKIFDELASFPASWRSAIVSSPHFLLRSENAANWANTDLESLGFTKDESNRIKVAAIDRMMNRDALTGLAVMNTLDLSQQTRRELIENAVGSSGNTPERLDAIEASLGSDEDREIARAARLTRLPGVNIDKPAEWLETVAAVDPAQAGSQHLLSVLRSWDSDKLLELAGQFKSMTDDSQKEKVARAILGSGYSDHPLEGAVIGYLVAHPSIGKVVDEDPFAEPLTGDEVSQSIQRASRYVGQLAEEDPGSAGDWVRSLPDGDAKLWSAKSLINVWSLYDPTAADRWLKSLPASTQSKLKELGRKP